MVVGKIAPEEVIHKLDIQYVADQFTHIRQTVVLFRCTRQGGEDEAWEEEGIRHFIIELPYDLIVQLDDVRPVMLAKIQERLG